MVTSLYRCINCSRYTLEKKCPACGKETFPPCPPKFSLEDKYGHYRREIKKKELQEKGLY